MNSLILSAGLGTRLLPLTKNCPKCLMPFGEFKIIDFWINYSKSLNCQNIYINTYYLADMVIDYLSNRYPNEIKFINETKLHGTAGTLINLIDNLNSFDDFFIVHADNFSIFNAVDFYNKFLHRPDYCVGTIMSFITDRPKDCGILEAKNNLMMNIQEKVDHPPSNLANAAAYIFDKNLIAKIKNSNYSDIAADILPMFFGKINIYHNDIYHRDIGYLDDYKNSLKFYEKNKQLHKDYLP